MIVLSVEGPGYINRDLWATHKILGVFNTRQEATESEAYKKLSFACDEIVLITDTEGGDVDRIEAP